MENTVEEISIFDNVVNHQYHVVTSQQANEAACTEPTLNSLYV